jgi:hypothetical protein
MKLLLNRKSYCPREIANKALLTWAQYYEIPVEKGRSPLVREDGTSLQYLALEGIEADPIMIAMFEDNPRLFSKGFKIVEIPDGIEYEIIEGYDDGYQQVLEKGRCW